MGIPGVKTTAIPDATDVLDAGDVLQGLGVDGRRRVVGGFRDLLSADEQGKNKKNDIFHAAVG